MRASAASRKYPGIRAPLHPLQLRCASSPYSPPVRLHSRALLARRIDALDASGYLRDATLGISLLLVLLFLSPAAGSAAEGYRVYESPAASVNSEVRLVSDVARGV